MSNEEILYCMEDIKKKCLDLHKYDIMIKAMEITKRNKVLF